MSLEKSSETVFHFGQILNREDICDREQEVETLMKICRSKGNAIVYGPRRYGKTSVLKNVVLDEFISKSHKTLGIYADLFQVDSMEEFVLRFQRALEKALSEKARVKSFLLNIVNYLKGLQISFGVDPISQTPTVSLTSGTSKRNILFENLFETLRALAEKYELLIILDEFQDIRFVKGLEGRLRSELQDLNNTSVILSGSHAHILKDFFYRESRPFYAFGTDVIFKEIDRKYWLPYMKKRFAAQGIELKSVETVNTICESMRDVPNAVQELCHWISISEVKGVLTADIVREKLVDMIENKSSRLIEHLASFSSKERNILFAIAQEEPVSSIGSIHFLKTAQVSATATRAAIQRFLDQGVLSLIEKGYVLTDPVFKLMLLRMKP